MKTATSDINTNKRLFDLVRYQRAELHEAGLITDEEYAWLCMEAPLAKGGGSPSPRRLEDYDDICAKMENLRTALRLFTEKDVKYLCEAMRRARLTTDTGEFHAHVSNVSVATIILNVLRQDYALAALNAK